MNLISLLLSFASCVALLFASDLAAFVRSWPVLGLSWPLLGGSWPLLGRSWALLDRSGPLLGSSWAALGRSWEALGRLFGALGPLLAALGAILERHEKINKKTMPKMIDLGSQKGAQREQK